MANEVRIDKWLWAARLYKTRAIATEACKKGRVSMGGITLKPSRIIKVGDVINVRRPPITWSFKVLQTIQNRVGPKLVPEILENVTPKEQLDVLEMSLLSGANQRAKGTGRPTKKDRRDIVEFATEADWVAWLEDDDELSSELDETNAGNPGK